MPTSTQARDQPNESNDKGQRNETLLTSTQAREQPNEPNDKGDNEYLLTSTQARELPNSGARERFRKQNPTSVPCSWELSLKDEVVRHGGEGSHGDSWRDLGMHCCVVKHLTTWP